MPQGVTPKEGCFFFLMASIFLFPFHHSASVSLLWFCGFTLCGAGLGSQQDTAGLDETHKIWSVVLVPVQSLAVCSILLPLNPPVVHVPCSSAVESHVGHLR